MQPRIPRSFPCTVLFEGSPGRVRLLTLPPLRNRCRRFLCIKELKPMVATPILGDDRLFQA